MSALLASHLDLNVIWKILNMISQFVVRNNFVLFTIYHCKCKIQAKYFTLILLRSGDISLNPGTPHNSQIDCLSWNVFHKKGFHFLHINVNSLTKNRRNKIHSKKNLKQT